jgi:hypothetical protein
MLSAVDNQRAYYKGRLNLLVGAEGCGYFDTSVVPTGLERSESAASQD